MKKVLLTSMILLSTVSYGGNVYAQETSGDAPAATTPTTAKASVTFTPSVDGKTLTISGQGDLTSLTKVSAELKFTSDGCQKVGTNNNMYNNSPVGQSAVYNSETVYYARYPKKIESLYPDFVDASVTYSWNVEKIESLYHLTWENNQEVWSKVNVSDNIDFDTDWTTVNGNFGVYARYATSEDGSCRMSLEDFKNAGYYNTNLSNVTFKQNNFSKLYILVNNKYTALATDATYDVNETYYSWDPTFQDASMVTFGIITEDEMLKMGYLEHPEETVAQQLDYLLSNNNTFTTIAFVNEDATQPLKINDDIVKAILYPASSATISKSNDVLTTLDLGAATCVDFSKETFAQGNASGYPIVETLTLPLSESNETPKGAIFNLQGQYHKLTKVVIPEGYTKIGDQTFSLLDENNGTSNLLSEVVLPSTLSEIGESAFRNCLSLKNVNFNENLKTIGKYAFAGSGLEGTLTLPKGLDKVCDGAFWDLKNLLVVELNENLRYIGNGAFGCSGNLADASTTQTTIKIPASVQYIGAYAFAERKYQDVYFYGKVAPVCPTGRYFDGKDWREDGTAFTGTDDKVYYGNSGFTASPSEDNPLADDANGDGYANRENYKGKYYFTIMHYPSDVEDEDTYTDTTRKYDCRVNNDNDIINTAQIPVGKEKPGSLNYREGGNVQQNVDPGYGDTYVGAQYVWPSQSQFVRAFVTAALGLKWDGVTPYSPGLSETAKAVLEEAGYDLSDENLANIAYRGTRKFAICNGDGKSTPKYQFDVTNGQWWTLCVPFNMTKRQVLDTFGEDTKLCLFSSVIRQIDINNRNHIQLNFTTNVLKHKTQDADGKKLQTEQGRWNYAAIENETQPDDNDIVIWAHESYMIKPMRGEHSDKDAVFVVDNYEAVEGNPLPTIVKAKTVQLGQADDEEKEYRFIGNYLGSDETSRVAKVIIPQYSYVYAKIKSDPTYKFRFYTGTTNVWKANKSLVQTNDRTGADDYQEFFGAQPTSAKQASVFGEENFGEVTGIEDVTIVADSDVFSPIYTLDGKMVSADGNKERLVKGIYIQAGKKFVVK